MNGTNERIKRVVFENNGVQHRFEAIDVREDFMTVAIADVDAKEIAFTLVKVDENGDGIWKTEDMGDGGAPDWRLLYLVTEFTTPRFCMWCGEKLLTRYPGGDPENGPASLRCKDDTHATLEEQIYQSHHDMSIEKNLEQASYKIEELTNFSALGGPKTFVLTGLRRALDAVAKQIGEAIFDHDQAEEQTCLEQYKELYDTEPTKEKE